MRIVLGSICLIIAGCAGVDPGKLHRIPIGAKVSFSGFLVFDRENMNIYPSADWKADLIAGRCIPVGVAPESDLGHRLEALSGRMVQVRGTVSTLVPDDEVSVAYCKSIGVVVRSIATR